VRATEEVSQIKEDVVSTGTGDEWKQNNIHEKKKRIITNLKQYLIMDRQVLEGVQDFRYLDTLINSKKCNK